MRTTAGAAAASGTGATRTYSCTPLPPGAEPTVATITAALETGPYGRCVYACDNDVVDHQVVNFEFEGGATASLTTVAFTEKVCQRQTRVFGSKGELTGDGERLIRHYDFASNVATVIEADVPPATSKLSGHGGADYFLISSFVAAIANDDATAILSGPEETLESHLMVFAAEQSRRKGVTVHLSGGGPDAAPLAVRDLSW